MFIVLRDASLRETCGSILLLYLVKEITNLYLEVALGGCHLYDPNSIYPAVEEVGLVSLVFIQTPGINHLHLHRAARGVHLHKKSVHLAENFTQMFVHINDDVI